MDCNLKVEVFGQASINPPTFMDKYSEILIYWGHINLLKNFEGGGGKIG